MQLKEENEQLYALVDDLTDEIDIQRDNQARKQEEMTLEENMTQENERKGSTATNFRKDSQNTISKAK